MAATAPRPPRFHNRSKPPELVGSGEAQMILSAGRSKMVDRAAVIRWGRQGRITIIYRSPGKNGAIFYDRASVEKLAAELAGDNGGQASAS